MVSEIRRTVLKGQEVDDNGNLLVSDIPAPPTIEQPLAAA